MSKIILFTDSLGAGGAQRQLVGLAALLKNVGHKVSVLTYHKDEFYASFLDSNNVKHFILPNANGTFKRIAKVCRYIKKESPDVLISYQEVPSLIACIAKILSPKIKLIVSERNTTQVITQNEKIRFFLYRWANAIVPNSYSQEKFIKSHYPKLADKVTTITNFVDLEKFAIEKQRAKAKRPTIMIAASIFGSKNTLGFIEAIRIIKDKGINFNVKWYGYSERNIDYFNQCTSKIKEYEIEEYIQLLPKTQNIKKCYAECDFFCLPSFFEGTPNVICEAISCACPVLCSDVCDNSIYVHEGENGTLFNPKSPESIASAIERILSINEKQYIEYSKNSRKIAEEKLSARTFLAKYEELINRL